MAKVDVVRAAMVQAMKNGEKERKNALSMLLSALKNATIDKRADLTDEESDVVIRKEIKQTQETLESTPADRTDIIDQCKLRISVYEEFVPKMMEVDEIKTVIEKVLADLGIEAPTMKDKGKIMKVLMPLVKGKADGKVVNETLTGYWD
ncbi:MAG: GatB/YqeY domain-containing protein [Clostridiales bacterium]|nr:GatB/YqeY domain-containing protein [Clostridiales bacterium]MDY3745636.1 GatB/YqeY domain-containing protein [Lachnospiraceae bacterium]